MPSEIVEAFARLRRDAPQRPLIYLPGADRVLSISDVNEAADEVARGLEAAGLSPRAVIAGAIGNRPSAVASFLACRRRGTPYLPLDVGTPGAEIADVGRQFGVAAILLASPQVLPGYSRISSFPSGLTIAMADADPGETRFGEAAMLKMTSGSTGKPRATLTTEAHLLTDARTLMRSMDVGPDDVQVAAIPLSHAYGIGNLLLPALIQGSALLMRDAFVPQRLPDDVRRVGARVFAGVPFMFDHFAANLPAGGWPSSLTRLISAGAPLERTLAVAFLQRHGVKIHSFYGTSETGGIAFDDRDEVGEEGTVGKALPGVTITLIPYDGAPAGTGRVHVAGPSVIAGYADRVDAEHFDGAGFLTGDLGRFNAAQQLTLTGRISSFVNVAGRKVQPEEVEHLLRQMNGVADVRVLGVADARRGQQLVAALVTRGAQPSVVALRQFCALSLPSFKIPRAFVFLDRIPVTERGKTDRRGLESMVELALARNAGLL